MLREYLDNFLQEKLPQNNNNSEFDKVPLLAPADAEVDSEAQQVTLRLEQNRGIVVDTTTQPADQERRNRDIGSRTKYVTYLR